MGQFTNALHLPADFLVPYRTVNTSQELLVPFQIDFSLSGNKCPNVSSHRALTIMCETKRSSKSLCCLGSPSGVSDQGLTGGAAHLGLGFLFIKQYPLGRASSTHARHLSSNTVLVLTCIFN